MHQNIAHEGFREGNWSEDGNVDVADFIRLNFTPFEEEFSDIAGPTKKTERLWEFVQKTEREQREQGIYEAQTKVEADVNAFEAGYIGHGDLSSLTGEAGVQDDVIVGLQTEKLFKRPVMPRSGIRNTIGALEAHKIAVDETQRDIFENYVKTYNDAAFDLYTPTIRKLRSHHVLSALPDNSSRGRLIGEYERVALYGVDYLIELKHRDYLENAKLIDKEATNEVLQLQEELVKQKKALSDLKMMALKYGKDISQPAKTAQEAIQWTYFAFLGAVKQQDGAAMSFGRVDSFFDIYIQRDLERGVLTEQQAQELIDNLVIKLRVVRFLRHPAFDVMYSGDPFWATVTVGGMDNSGKPRVTKTSYRLLNTLNNLGPSPEPNLTVLWNEKLPENFKRFCADLSIRTSTIQYENDELIREAYGEHTAIACCVSPVPRDLPKEVQKDGNRQSIQLFGARYNGMKTFYLSLNGGLGDGRNGVEQVFPEGTVKSVVEGAEFEPIEVDGEVLQKSKTPLDFEKVWNEHFLPANDFVIGEYVSALNLLHYACDRYFYESLEMALHDTHVHRTMGCGLAGLSHIVDGLSAIKYAKVYPVVNDDGLIVDFVIDSNDFPRFGNDDDRADEIAKDVVAFINSKLHEKYMYRGAEATLSLLTITANIPYGKAVLAGPDGARLLSNLEERVGRGPFEPLAPGANPSNGVDQEGVVASMASVGKIPFDDCRDGISLTTTILPASLGADEESKVTALAKILDKMFTGVENAGYSTKLYHSNINVLTKEMLEEAYANPDDPKFNNLCVRISGYCVLWSKLTQEQRLDILHRTFHEKA